ncbi:MAG TPA: MFS transporter [Chloroflexota bacterium]|nr:MFS transporter [Chloroflexota bacterium]
MAYPFVHYPQELIALRLVHGGATAIWGPVVAALVADLFPRTRAESMGWYRSARSASYFLGPLLGGLVLLRVDARAAWLAVGALAMTAALGVVLGLGEAAVVPPLNALATQVVEGRSYGSRLGLLEATDNVGKAGGPILAGLLIGRLHFAGCFIIIAGLLLAAPATFSIGARPGAPAAREGLLPARGAEPRRR